MQLRREITPRSGYSDQEQQSTRPCRYEFALAASHGWSASLAKPFVPHVGPENENCHYKRREHGYRWNDAPELMDRDGP